MSESTKDKLLVVHKRLECYLFYSWIFKKKIISPLPWILGEKISSTVISKFSKSQVLATEIKVQICRTSTFIWIWKSYAIKIYTHKVILELLNLLPHHFIYIYTLLNFVKLSTLLIKKGSHKRYATLTTLAVVWALWSFKIFFWSELYWWALKERSNI